MMKRRVRAQLMQHFYNVDKVDAMMSKSFDLVLKSCPDASVKQIANFIAGNEHYSFRNRKLPSNFFAVA